MKIVSTTMVANENPMNRLALEMLCDTRELEAAPLLMSLDVNIERERTCLVSA